MDNDKEDVEKIRIIPSMSPTSATDYINTAFSKQGTLMLQLMSTMPDFHVENHRTVVSAEYVKHFIKSLCEMADYYPRKPRKKQSKK